MRVQEGLPSAAAAPNMITAEPFDSSAFTNEVVKDPLRHPDSSPRVFISALIRVDPEVERKPPPKFRTPEEEYAALCRDHQQATAPVEIDASELLDYRRFRDQRPMGSFVSRFWMCYRVRSF